MNGHYLFNLAGLQFRKADAKDAVRQLQVGDLVQLVRESDSNILVYDENAVRVVIPNPAGSGPDLWIGFVERLVNPPIAEFLDRFDSPQLFASVKAVYPDDPKHWQKPLLEVQL